MCACVCVSICSMWLTLTLQLDAHADSIGKLSKGTNKTLLCSGNVSGMLGLLRKFTSSTKRRIPRYIATLLLRMSYYSNYSCKWRGMLSCKQQLHGGNCLVSTDSVCAVFSLGCFLRALHTLLCKYTPLSMFQRLLHSL